MRISLKGKDSINFNSIQGYTPDINSTHVQFFCFSSVSEKELNIMMKNIDHLLVLFHDRRKISQKALSALEDIDDDCDDLGISFVEVSNSYFSTLTSFCE